MFRGRFFVGIILGSLCLFVSASSVLAWEIADKRAYQEKMDLLRAMVSRAASSPDNIREVCLVMSIGNDVNARYLEFNPDDAEERERGQIMGDQLSTCLAALYTLTEEK